MWDGCFLRLLPAGKWSEAIVAQLVELAEDSDVFLVIAGSVGAHDLSLARVHGKTGLAVTLSDGHVFNNMVNELVIVSSAIAVVPPVEHVDVALKNAVYAAAIDVEDRKVGLPIFIDAISADGEMRTDVSVLVVRVRVGAAADALGGDLLDLVHGASGVCDVTGRHP